MSIRNVNGSVNDPYKRKMLYGCQHASRDEDGCDKTAQRAEKVVSAARKTIGGTATPRDQSG